MAMLELKSTISDMSSEVYYVIRSSSKPLPQFEIYLINKYSNTYNLINNILLRVEVLHGCLQLMLSEYG